MKCRRLAALLGGSVLVLSGCADFGGPINGNSQTVLSPQERRLQDLENKTAQLSRRLDTMNASGTDQEMARLRDEVRDLRGMVEKLRYDSDQRDKNSKDLYQDLDRRLQRFENNSPPVAPGAPAMVPSTVPGTMTTAPTAQRPTVASPEEESAYLATFDMLKNGRYDDAIAGFKSMLVKWPQGRYADNAYYWMGQASFIKRDYPSALNSYQTLVDKFPTSPKLSDALYNIGLCQIEMNHTTEAKATLQRVTREFPTTNAATMSKQKLDQLGR